MKIRPGGRVSIDIFNDFGIIDFADGSVWAVGSLLYGGAAMLIEKRERDYWWTESEPH